MIYRLFLFIFLFIYSNIHAQLEVSSININDEVLENLVISELLGCNVQISNIEYTGNTEAFGSFSYTENQDLCTGGFDLTRGLLMTTGMIDHAVGPNDDGDDGEEWNIQYDDINFSNYLLDNEVILSNVDFFDASILEFDITSSTFNTLDFELIFGSEEYVEWMSPFYADAFCFFVSEVDTDIDPNFDQNPQNIMETGDVLNLDDFMINNVCEIENKPISTWTVRPYSQVFNAPGVNECLYVDNQNGEFCDAIGYDGYTVPMLFEFNMLPEAIYHVKMVIVDGAGSALDSGVFIRRADETIDSTIDFTWSELEYNDIGTTISFNNISTVNMNTTFFWDFDTDGIIDSSLMNPSYTFEVPGDYVVTLEVVNNCTGYVSTISYEITIGSTSLSSIDTPVVSIFPNPANDFLNIKITDIATEYDVELIDFSGRVVYSLINVINPKIDTKSLKSGFYHINIKNESSLFHSEKILIL